MPYPMSSGFLSHLVGCYYCTFTLGGVKHLPAIACCKDLLQVILWFSFYDFLLRWWRFSAVLGRQNEGRESLGGECRPWYCYLTPIRVHGRMPSTLVLINIGIRRVSQMIYDIDIWRISVSLSNLETTAFIMRVSIENHTEAEMSRTINEARILLNVSSTALGGWLSYRPLLPSLMLSCVSCTVMRNVYNRNM